MTPDRTSAGHTALDENEVLHRRAAALAARPHEADAADVADLIVFRLDDRAYAVPAEQVLAVRAVTVLALPGVSPLHAGVVHHRGVINALINVGALLGVTGGEKPGHALFIAAPHQAIALAASAIDGLVSLSRSQIGPLTGDDRRHAFISGTTPDGILVLDALQLAQDARLVINEQASMPDRTEGSEEQ